jgi:hypothetical protein
MAAVGFAQKENLAVDYKGRHGFIDLKIILLNIKF